MAVINNGLPKTNLKADDIRDTLNANGGSVTNDHLTFFKASAKINRWSKWKPIHIPNADFVDDESRFAAYDWGISIPWVVNDLTAAFNGCSESDYALNLPKGGSSSPYRLGDFRGYRADATSPFYEIQLDRGSAVAGDSVTATLYCRMYNSSNQAGMLGLADMATLKDCHVIFIKKSPSGSLSTAMSSETISAHHGMASATFSAFTTASHELGTHTIMAALTKGNGTYYLLPVNKASVKVEQYFLNDYFEKPYGEAYYNSYGNTGYITFNMVIHAGTQTTSGPVFNVPLYAGASPNFMVGPLAYGSITVQKGKQGTLRITWSQNSSNWETYKYLLQNSEIYIDSSSSGMNATKINVSGG